MKLYLSGPMSDVPKHNYPAFNKATKSLRKIGYKVVSPAELDDKTKKPLTWEECLRRDLSYVVRCDAIATLPGWQDSRGANLEIYVAKKLNMPVYPVGYFISIKKKEK